MVVMAQGGKGMVCPHAMNKIHCQGKDPSTRLLPRLSKMDPAFYMLYFLSSPEQDLGHRCQSELLFAFLANIYLLHFPSARQLTGERSWCRAQARRTELSLHSSSAAAVQGRAPGTSRLARPRGNTHPPLPPPTTRRLLTIIRRGRFFSSFWPLLQGFRSDVFF